MAIPPGKGLRCFPEEPATTGYVKSFMHTPHISFSRGEPLRAERRTRYSTRSQQEKTRRIEKTVPHTGATCYNRPRQRKHGVSSFTDPATRKDTSSTLSDPEGPSQWPKSRCREYPAHPGV